MKLRISIIAILLATSICAAPSSETNRLARPPIARDQPLFNTDPYSQGVIDSLQDSISQLQTNGGNLSYTRQRIIFSKVNYIAEIPFATGDTLKYLNGRIYGYNIAIGILAP